MSKESYARGFCKAAAAAGVDPHALAKYAQWYNPLSWFGGDKGKQQSAKVTEKRPSYIDALWGNRRRAQTFDHEYDYWHPGSLPKKIEDALGENRPLSKYEQEELDVRRRNLAENNAWHISSGELPDEVVDRIKDNLIQQGIDNERQFRKDKTVPYRAVPDMRGLEGVSLTPEQWKMLRDNQNLQVNNSRFRANGKGRLA